MGKHSFKLAAVLPLVLLMAFVAWHERSCGPSAGARAFTVDLVASSGDDVPFSLTASDGTGLRPVSASSQSVIHDPLAFTEMHLVFENPESRVLEGRFSIALPERASITRFAMKVNGGWQEGEVVDKRRGRRTYEDFLHRRQDPALLELGAGNSFSARVFPIPAQSKKEIIVSYLQELDQERVSLVRFGAGRPLDALDISVHQGASSSPIRRVSLQHHEPPGDVVLNRAGAQKPRALLSGDLAIARFAVPGKPETEPFESTLILVDTSASRAVDLDAEIDLVKKLADTIATQTSPTRLAVVAFDQTIETVYAGSAAARGAAAFDRLKQRGALGATDIVRAITASAPLAAQHGLRRAIVLTDGIATAGSAEIRAAVGQLKECGIERVDAIAFGAVRDDAALRALVTRENLRAGVVVRADEPFDRIEKRLTTSVHHKLAVKVQGAWWVHPTAIDGVQPGDEVLVYAKVDAEMPVRIALGDLPIVTAQSVPGPEMLVRRSWAQAKIASVLARDIDADEKREQVLKVALPARVITPYTSFLVLETADDYRRYGIERTALADIAGIVDGRVAAVDWERLDTEEKERRAADERAPRTAAERERKAKLDYESNRHASNRGGEDDWVAFGNSGDSFGTSEAGRGSRFGVSGPSTGGASNDPVSARGNMWGDLGLPVDRQNELRDASEFGLIGTLGTPSAPWGASVGDAFGAAGLGLTGIGEGRGAAGQGIGVSSTGTLGSVARGYVPGNGRNSAVHSTAAPRVRTGQLQVNGRLPTEVVQRIVRQNYGRFRLCYENGLRGNPNLQGRVEVRFVIGRDGAVSTVSNGNSNLPDASVVKCVLQAYYGLSFPQPEGGIVTVVYPIVFDPGEGSPPPKPPELQPPFAFRGWAPSPPADRFTDVMSLIASHEADAAVRKARAWRNNAPAELLAVIALGEALETAKDAVGAARAYGSIIDLFPERADMRRFASGHLERVDGPEALELARDALSKAMADRPDQLTTYRMLAYVLLKQGSPAEAFGVLRTAVTSWEERNRPGVMQVLREDIGLVAAAWAKADPDRRADINAKVVDAGGVLETEPSLRFALTWETDANDVDLLMTPLPDGSSGHGRLYANVTTGYGPEVYAVRGQPRATSYHLGARYTRSGPMGLGLGKLQIVEHDGKGGLRFDERPFVLRSEGAYADLGTYAG